MTVLEVTPLRWPQIQRGLLTVIAAVLFALGWSAAVFVKGLRLFFVALGYAAGWSFAAVRVGWQAGRVAA